MERQGMAVFLLTTFVFGAIFYLTLSSFLVYNHKELMKLNRLQESVLMRNKIRSAVDCAASCQENLKSIPKVLGTKLVTASCDPSNPRAFFVKVRSPDSKKQLTLWPYAMGSKQESRGMRNALCSMIEEG